MGGHTLPCGRGRAPRLAPALCRVSAARRAQPPARADAERRPAPAARHGTRAGGRSAASPARRAFGGAFAAHGRRGIRQGRRDQCRRPHHHRRRAGGRSVRWKFPTAAMSWSMAATLSTDRPKPFLPTRRSRAAFLGTPSAEHVRLKRIGRPSSPFGLRNLVLRRTRLRITTNERIELPWDSHSQEDECHDSHSLCAPVGRAAHSRSQPA